MVRARMISRSMETLQFELSLSMAQHPQILADGQDVHVPKFNALNGSLVVRYNNVDGMIVWSVWMTKRCHPCRPALSMAL
jgi:hypothetical protein